MKVLNEYETINEIIKKRCSVTRFGSGELKLCLNMDHKCQPSSQLLSNKLKMILKDNISNLMVAVPRFSKGSNALEMKFWRNCCSPKFKALYNLNKVYGSSFITRPDMVPDIDNSHYWSLMQEIWQDQNIVLFQGAGRSFGDDRLLHNAKNVTHLYGERKNAFRNLKIYVNSLKRFRKRHLIILSLGPTATVLSYELAKLGCWVLDLGHAGVFYSGQHPKSSNYDGGYYDDDKC